MAVETDSGSDALSGSRVVLAPRRWSLRARLVALLIVLLTVVSASIVGITALVLRSYLIHQVDLRVMTVDSRWSKNLPPSVARTVAGGTTATPGSPGASGAVAGGTGAASGSTGSNLAGGVATGGGASPHDIYPTDPFGAPQVPGWDASPAQFVGLSGQEAGTLAARVVDGGVVTASVLGPVGVTTALPLTVANKLVSIPVDEDPHTISLRGFGEYRVAARQAPGGVVVISGLSLSGVNATVNQLILVAGGVAAAGVVLLGVAGGVTVRRTLAPLRRVTRTARRVAELPLHRGEVTLSIRVPEGDTDPRTEVGQVGAALNHMIDHVGAALAARHASETRVRQFVADASHELRTPLAAISGYAQLSRRFGDAVPADVAYAIGRVESETKRMTALVEDLLLLARLDSGRPLEHAPVDLSHLVVDVVSDAHIAAPGHRFSLALPREPVAVQGDQARLHQVLANLLANARTHTPAGTRVTVSLDPLAHRRELRLSVTDDGPGIAEGLLPHIFERFARGDSSRSRGAGSTGLGLAIVAAVVEAHGGRISVASRPSRTVFTVTLPYAPLAAPLVFGDEDDELVLDDAVGLDDDLDLANDLPAAGPVAARFGASLRS
jgi:two-component system OmpR family sensor kinase